MLNKEISRRGFCAGMFAAVVAAKAARAADAADGAELDLRQREIDAITPDEFAAYWRPGIELAKDELDAAYAASPINGDAQRCEQVTVGGESGRDARVCDYDW
ncbi:MAG: hypothetical protein J6V72_09945, partial [Kiritimatiellae bacterium]|nr:hypothetical protein [Kiritimatiellia bacterium]